MFELPTRAICGDKACCCCWQPEGIEHTEQSYDCHSQCVNAQSLGAQGSRQVHFEEKTGSGRQNGSRKIDRRLSSDARYAAVKLAYRDLRRNLSRNRNYFGGCGHGSGCGMQVHLDTAAFWQGDLRNFRPKQSLVSLQREPRYKSSFLDSPNGTGITRRAKDPGMLAMREHVLRNIGNTHCEIPLPALCLWCPAVEEEHRVRRRRSQHLTQLGHLEPFKWRDPAKMDGNIFRVCERQSFRAGGLQPAGCPQ